MPVTFTVKAGKLPSIEQFIVDVMERTGWELIVCPTLLEKEDPSVETQWEEDKNYIFYLPFESSRGVEFWFLKGNIHVKLMPVSAHGDFALVRELLREVLQYGGGGIVSDDGLKAESVDKLNEVYDLNWFAEFTISGVERLFEMVSDDPDSSVGLVGPSRYFYFGQGIAEVMLKESDDPLDIAERLWPMMSTIQYLPHYPEYEGYAECAQFELDLPRLKGKTFAYLPPEEGVLVPKTDFLAVDADAEGEFALLPAKHFKKLLPQLFEKDELAWLDEFQFVLPPMKKRRYKKFVDGIMRHCKLVKL